MDNLAEEILVVVTTFNGSRERNLILRKVLRHFRIKNKIPYAVILLSDGNLDTCSLDEYVDYHFASSSQLGMNRGEHFSIRVALDFALAQGYKYMLKMGGDIICNRDEWVEHFYKLMRNHGKELLSTHWFYDDSFIFGTKFFLANCEVFKKIYPKTVGSTILETEVTNGIVRHYDFERIAYMINSMTGELHENRNELRALDWQHAHKIYKFKDLDIGHSSVQKNLNKFIVYPGFRLVYNLRYLNPFRKRSTKSKP
jgi:hypothetical protein